jgi:hypothetical protein
LKLKQTVQIKIPQFLKSFVWCISHVYFKRHFIEHQLLLSSYKHNKHYHTSPDIRSCSHATLIKKRYIPE